MNKSRLAGPSTYALGVATGILWSVVATMNSWTLPDLAAAGLGFLVLGFSIRLVMWCRS